MWSTLPFITNAPVPSQKTLHSTFLRTAFFTVPALGPIPMLLYLEWMKFELVSKRPMRKDLHDANGSQTKLPFQLTLRVEKE